MNSFIDTSNLWGETFLSFAWPMLWQSSLLITGLLILDHLFRRRLRASLRYALWLVVLLKLCVPPTLALPTSPAWWLHKTPPPAVAKAKPHYTITYDNDPLPETPLIPLPLCFLQSRYDESRLAAGVFRRRQSRPAAVAVGALAAGHAPR